MYHVLVITSVVWLTTATTRHTLHNVVSSLSTFPYVFISTSHCIVFDASFVVWYLDLRRLCISRVCLQSIWFLVAILKPFMNETNRKAFIVVYHVSVKAAPNLASRKSRYSNSASVHWAAPPTPAVQSASSSGRRWRPRLADDDLKCSLEIHLAGQNWTCAQTQSLWCPHGRG